MLMMSMLNMVMMMLKMLWMLIAVGCFLLWCVLRPIPWGGTPALLEPGTGPCMAFKPSDGLSA